MAVSIRSQYLETRGKLVNIMIYAIGIDLAEVARVRQAIERHGERFLQRIFTDGELAYCQRFYSPWERYAARFAAKEAGMKSLGNGWHGVAWRDF